MAPLEPWEKVLINFETYGEDLHSAMTCTYCHNGDSAANEKEIAHTDLNARPSDGEDTVCGVCHSEIQGNFAQSLHYAQAGYWTALDARADLEDEATHAALQEMFGNHCSSCHTTCGDCHVSQPASVDGGLIDSHVFNAKPSITRNCTACHGSRVGNEYLGKNEGVMADTHFRSGRMACVDCHTAAEMHGEYDGEDINHRYDGAESPKCTNCHNLEDDGNVMHSLHGDTLSCQVCHSVSYTSCDSCHVAVSDETGNAFFSTEGSYMTFFIGKNPLISSERPYQYVLLRHVPVDPESFAYYGDNLLADFDAVPTWVYATPHNIQKDTPQNSSCDSCHDNADIFLTADKVNPEELEANAPVIVESVPSLSDFGN